MTQNNSSTLVVKLFLIAGLIFVFGLLIFTLFIGLPRDRFDIALRGDTFQVISAAKEKGAPVEAMKIQDGTIRLFPTVSERSSWQYFLASADAKRGEGIAQNGTKAGAPACSSCHGTTGQPEPGQGFPRLAGMDVRYISASLFDYANGRRGNEVMEGIAKALSPQDMTDVAVYYAAAKADRAPVGAPDPKAMERGQQLHQYGDQGKGVQACNACHGKNGQGGLPRIPYLAGQDQDYVTGRIAWFRKVTPKTQGQTQMAAVAKHLSDDDAKAVAIYYATLNPPNVP